MFAKNERGYRLNAIKKCLWSLLILLLSVASIRRKLLKTTHTEERSFHTNSTTIYECVEKKSMTIVCNIWMICLELNRFVYDPSWMLHLSEFVWTLRSSVAKKQIRLLRYKFNQFSRLGWLSSNATPWPLISPNKLIFTFV